VTLAKSEMAISRMAQEDLMLLLSELTQNVLDHSQSVVGGFISARAYKDVRDVRFAVADFGVGIRQTLGRQFSIASDEDAIRKALEAEVTSKSSSRNLGLGLSHLHDVVRLTGGRMVIYSGNGFLRREHGKDLFRSSDTPFPGTIAFVRLPPRQPEHDEPSDVTDIWA
jgi:signal transduction histidine kinase